ncbi:MAG: TIGR02996 domain-containing protein [Kofleriaceae bacterium]
MSDALLAALIANPDDEATWQVYRDWLLERGDPRGAMIDETDDQLIGQFVRSIVTDRLAAMPEHWVLIWKRGFIDAARYHYSRQWPTAETIDALLDDPSTALLRSLDLRHSQIARCYDALFAREIPSLRQLSVDVSSHPDVIDGLIEAPLFAHITTLALAATALADIDRLFEVADRVQHIANLDVELRMEQLGRDERIHVERGFAEKLPRARLQLKLWLG